MFLRKKRKEKGLTQTELAHRVHVAQSMISNIENGVRSPSVALARRLGAALEVEWTEIFDDGIPEEDAK